MKYTKIKTAAFAVLVAGLAAAGGASAFPPPQPTTSCTTANDGATTTVYDNDYSYTYVCAGTDPASGYWYLIEKCSLRNGAWEPCTYY